MQLTTTCRSKGDCDGTCLLIEEWPGRVARRCGLCGNAQAADNPREHLPVPKNQGVAAGGSILCTR
jgi:hypothetical protein